jgi:ABC-type branched-subunit amino acid transport system ATPase component
MGSLRCVNLCNSFDGTAALDGLALSLPARGLVAIIGPNGAGKTTLLNVFTGFLRPDAGEVFLDAVNLTRLPPHRIVQTGVARTFQELRLAVTQSVNAICGPFVTWRIGNGKDGSGRNCSTDPRPRHRETI